MSRKRKPDQESSPATSTAIVEPPVAESATAVVEPPATESNGDGQSFADKVGEKKWVATPDPFGIAKDNVAGVRLFESKQDRQMAIKFGEGRPEDKPSQPVIDRMKEAGYRWNPSDRIWVHPVRPEFAMGTRIDAEKLYQEVRQMIRQEKGIEATQDIPF
jgi:hypothetical protein